MITSDFFFALKAFLYEIRFALCVFLLEASKAVNTLQPYDLNFVACAVKAQAKYVTVMYICIAFTYANMFFFFVVHVNMYVYWNMHYIYIFVCFCLHPKQKHCSIQDGADFFVRLHCILYVTGLMC